MLTNALAAVATLVSLAFACSTLERWLVRRRRHELAWTVSLFLFAAGSLALAAGAALGWDQWSFRAFYLFGGILNVPFLALGTVYLFAGPRRTDRWAAGLALISTFAAGVMLVAPINGAIDPSAFPTGQEHLGVLPRVLAGVGSGLAALVIIGGALWSAAALARGRRRPGAQGPSVVPTGRLAAANVLIAVGTIVISAKGLFAGLGDETTAFSAAVATGITIIFVGFLLTTSSPAPVKTAEPSPAGLPAPSEAPARRDTVASPSRRRSGADRGL